MNATQTTITTNPETGTVTKRTVSVKRIGTALMVVKAWDSKDTKGFTDCNSVIVCKGSKKRVQQYLTGNGLDLAIPVVR